MKNNKGPSIYQRDSNIEQNTLTITRNRENEQVTIRTKQKMGEELPWGEGRREGERTQDKQ